MHFILPELVGNSTKMIRYAKYPNMLQQQLLAFVIMFINSTESFRWLLRP